MKSQNSLRLLLVIVSTLFFQCGFSQKNHLSYKKSSKKSFSSLMDRANAYLDEQRDTLAARKLLYSLYQQAERKGAWKHYVPALELYGRCFVRQKEYQKGVKRLSQGIQKMLGIRNFPYEKISKLYQVKAELLVEARHYSKAAEVLETDLKNWEQQDTSMMNATLLYTLEKLGNYLSFAEEDAKAYPPLKRVIQELRNGAYTDTNRIIYLLTLYEYTLFKCGRYKERIDFLHESIEIAIELLPSNDFRLAKMYESTGYMYYNMGEFKEGLEYVDKALFIIEHGSYTEAELKEMNVSSIYIRKGMGHGVLDQREEALNAYETALRLIGSSRIEYQLQELSILGEMSGIYERNGALEKALECIKKADQLLQEYYSMNPDKDFFYHRFRNVHYHYSRYYANAGNLEKSIQHSLVILDNYSTPDRPWENKGIYNDLARNYFLLSKIDSALYYNHKALQAYTNNNLTGDYYALPKLEELPSLGDLYLILNQKVNFLTYWIENQVDPQNKELEYQKLLSIIEYIDTFHRSNLLKVNDFRSGNNQNLIANSVPVYQNGLKLAFDYAKLSGSQEGIKKAFYYAQKKKAQGLWLNTLSNKAIDKGFVPGSILEKERVILEKISYAEKEIFYANHDGNDERKKILENTLLFDSKKEYADLVFQMERDYPKYFKSKYTFELENIEDIQQLLGADEALIEYAFVDSSLYIFVLDQENGLRIEEVQWDAWKEKLVLELNEKLQSNSWHRKSSKTLVINSAHDLFNSFILPIKDQLQDKQRLIIIGEGITHYLPFEILLPSNELRTYHDLDYLIKDYEISYHYSANLFASARRAEVAAQEGILAFAPVYEDDVLAQAEPSGKSYFNSNLRAYHPNGTFTPLPESEGEVLQIGALFQSSDGKNEILLRGDAQKDRLKDRMELPFKYIHIAGHSFADLDNPKFSGIACWNTGNDYDDVLFSTEIYNLRIQADLVSLSSCESGFGKYDRSEGLMGINRAFIYAGAKNVVFSLWKVYDKVSADLMVNFYEEILKGQDYAASLRQAKLDLIRNPETAAPHLWSSFLLIGR